MLASVTELLRCIRCDHPGPLSLEAGAKRRGEQVMEGALTCLGCGASWPIEDGIADFVGGEDAGAGLAQRLMEAAPIPMIYERYWRPALMRMVQPPRAFEEEARVVVRLLRPQIGDNVADVACGTGNYTRRWARLVAHGPKAEGGMAVGFDRSAVMLRQAARQARAENLDNISFIRADVHQLPLRTSAWSGVACCAALHLFSNPGQVISEISSALKPGGRFACLTLEERESDWGRWMAQGSELLTGLHFFAREELEQLTSHARLEWIEAVRHGQVCIFVARASRTA